MKRLYLYLFSVLTLLFMPAMLQAQPQAVQEATERIRERLPDVDALKAASKVGENNQGFLAARQQLSEEESGVVTAENRDRRILYQHVAQTSRQSVDEVGRQRAARIAELARPGVWLQNQRGQWYQKR